MCAIERTCFPLGGNQLGGAQPARRFRARQRGAVLLESVLVISVLLLSLIGTVFVARIYAVSLRSVGLSRAAAIGYSIQGCKGDHAGSWFNEEEMKLLTGTHSEDGGDTTQAKVNDEKAQKMVTLAAQSGSFGSPKVMSTTTGGEVFGPLLNPERVGGLFFTDVQANDHVLCGEVSHRGGVLGVLGLLRDFFKF